MLIVLVLYLVQQVPSSPSIVPNLDLSSNYEDDRSDQYILNDKFELINDELARLNKLIILLGEKQKNNVVLSSDFQEAKDSVDPDTKPSNQEEVNDQHWDDLVENLEQGESSHDMDSELSGLFEDNSDIEYSSSCSDSGCKVTLLSSNASSLQKAQLTIMMEVNSGNAEFYVPPRSRGNQTEIYIKQLEKL